MRQIALALLGAATAAAGLCAHAQTQATRVGNTTYLNSSTGASATVTTIGPSSYYSDSSGLTGSATRVGDTRYSSYSNGLSATSRRVSRIVVMEPAMFGVMEPVPGV